MFLWFIVIISCFKMQLRIFDENNKHKFVKVNINHNIMRHQFATVLFVECQ